MITIKVVGIGVQSGSSCLAVINVQFVVHRCEEKQRFTVSETPKGGSYSQQIEGMVMGFLTDRFKYFMVICFDVLVC